MTPADVDQSALPPGEYLLLLDLDGVVVFEHGPPHIDALELLKLHDRFDAVIAGVGAPIVVLTHRSRVEASRILKAAGVPLASLAGVFAAEDLMIAGVRPDNLAKLARRGLRKSLALPVIEERHGVSRSKIAFIDDRLDNLEDMLASGLGLALHAPSSVRADGYLGSFDMPDALSHVQRWAADPSGPRLIALAERMYPLEPWRRTGLSTRRERHHLFNYFRATARSVVWAFRRLKGKR